MDGSTSSLRAVLVLTVMTSLFSVTVSEGQTTSITSSGLGTTISPPSIDPAGRPNYTITGGTRPGDGPNLFHSFGDFSVGTNNVARFFNETGRATTNILSRVTSGNPSAIFGEISTQSFGSANLFLINPAGIVFGPTASLNVGGSVHFSTADYLRLGSGNDRFYADLGKTSQLTSAPVTAFGFLGERPAGAITVQGATLNTHEQDPTVREPHRALSLVGGDISLSGANLKAPGGIDLVSMVAAGEVRTATVSGVTPPTSGTIRMVNSVVLTGDSSIPNSSSGPIVIRGGQLLMEQSTISASIDPAAAFQQFGAGHITLQLSDTIRATESHIVSNGGGFNQGTVALEAGQAIRLTKSTVEVDNVFGDPGTNRGFAALSAPVITLDGSHVSATGHIPCCGASGGGSIAIQANQFQMKNGSELTTVGAVEPGGGNIVITATENVSIDHSKIDVSGGGNASPFGNPGGDAGNISITAGEAVRLNHAEVLAEGAPSGPRAPGNGGNIVIDARENFVSQASTLSAHSDNLTGGNIMIQSREQLRLEGGLVSTAGAQGGTVNMQAGQFVLDNARVSAKGVEGGGKIAIDATDSVVLRNSPIALDVSGSNPIPIPAPGGEVTIQANRVVINDSGINANGMTAGGTVAIKANETIRMDGSRVETGLSILGGGGTAGNISIQAGDSVRLVNGTVLAAENRTTGNAGNIAIDGGGNVVVDGSRLTVEARRGEAGQVQVSAGDAVRLVNGTVVSANNLRQGPAGRVVLNAGGNVLVNGSLVTAEPIEGQPGQIHITAGEAVRVLNGSRLTVNNNGIGPAGTLTIQAGTNVVGENSTFVAQTGEGHGGTIQITAPDQVRLTNSIVSTGVGGSAASVGGSIAITSDTVRVENGRIVSNASNGSGGSITIKTNDFRPDEASVVEAQSLSGGGTNGTVTIQPLP
jgi:filamentous hemagglutinin family protein